MRIRAAIMTVTCCLGLPGFARTLDAQPTHEPSATALRFFNDLSRVHAGTMLRTLRPPRVAIDERVRALTEVPSRSVLEPSPRERVQLAALHAVLMYHDRQDAVDIKVIDVPAAAIALHARSVILISRPALGLLSRAELQATVAHELGHDYFWSAYWLAKQQADPIALQVLELKCDGIAALTLDALGVDPRYLSDAIAKIGKFNEVPSFRWGQNGYPHPRDRERFVKELLLSMQMKGR